MGGGLEGTKGRGWPSEGRDEEGGEQVCPGNRWRGGSRARQDTIRGKAREKKKKNERDKEPVSGPDTNKEK